MEEAMHRIVLVSIAGLAAVACSAEHPAGPTAAEQAGLAQALAGRTAGPAVSCVSQRDIGGNESFGEGTILFHGRTGGTVYVNQPAGGCPLLTRNRAITYRTTSSQLCRGEIVTVLDPVSHVEFGSCALGDFTPYRR